MKIPKCKDNQNPEGIPRFAGIYFFVWHFPDYFEKINGINKRLCFYLYFCI